MDNRLLNILFKYLNGLLTREQVDDQLEHYKNNVLRDINLILQVIRQKKDE